jgi:hypothetical protein
MVKLDLKTPGVVLGVSFVLIFFAVFTQSCGRDRERLTETPTLNDKEKREVTLYFEAIREKLTPDMSKISSKASKFIQFTNDHPITLITQKTVDAIQSYQETTPPMTVESIRAHILINAVLPLLWDYGNTYTSLKEIPTRTEFDASAFKLIKGSWYERIAREWHDATETCNKYTPEQRKKTTYCTIYESSDFRQINPYPLKTDSPGVKAIFDFIYSYYYGDIPMGAIGASAQKLGSSLFTALFATFGTIGSIIVIALFTKYVLKLW